MDGRRHAQHRRPGLRPAARCPAASRSQSIGQLVLTYGEIVGSDVGLAHGVPLAVAARWFPERQGLASMLLRPGR